MTLIITPLSSLPQNQLLFGTTLFRDLLETNWFAATKFRNHALFFYTRVVNNIRDDEAKFSSTRIKVGLQYGHHQNLPPPLLSPPPIMLPQNYTATTSYSYAVLCCGPLSTAWKQGELFLSEISNDQSMNNFDWTSWKSNETELRFILFFSGKQRFAGNERKKLQYLNQFTCRGLGNYNVCSVI